MPIAHIMALRCFLLLADAGDVCLGDPLACPEEFETYVDSGGPFLDTDLMRVCNRAAERQWRAVVFPDLRRKSYRGVGKRAVPGLSNRPADARLLLVSVSTCREVRRFTRRCMEDKYWGEQSGWIRDDSLAAVNAALAALQLYAAHSEMRKDAYGAKAKGSSDQYAEYVPPEIVPDRFQLPTGGCTGTSDLWKQTTLSLRTSTEAAARLTQAATTSDGHPSSASNCQTRKKVRWSEAVHAEPLAQVLIASPFSRTVPKKQSDWVTLDVKMPPPGEGEQRDVETFKRHAKALLKSRPGVMH